MLHCNLEGSGPSFSPQDVVLKFCSIDARGAVLVPEESQVPEELISSPKVKACLLQIKQMAKRCRANDFRG